MKKIVIISLVLTFLFGALALAQQKSEGSVADINKFVIPKEEALPSTPLLNLKQPPPYVAPVNAVGKYTNMYSFYDYQLNGGSLDYIQMNPLDRNKIHTILMASNDSLNVSGSRRTWVNFSSNGGNTWGANPAVVPSLRSGYPSMTLNPYLGIEGSPAVVANHADLDGDGSLASYMYFEQTDGGLNFTEGFNGGLWGTDVTNQGIWPRITAATNGNTVMMAGRNNSAGVGIITFNTDGVFSSWYSIDTTGNGGSVSIKGGPNSMVAAVWPTGGNTMIGFKLWYSISRDNGLTWGPRVSIDSTKPDEFIYYGGMGVVFLDTTLFVAYPATNNINNSSYSYAASRIKIYNNETNTTVVAIDSTNFPLLRKTAPGDDVAQGWHSLGFTYPTLGTNNNGTRLYLACDAFVQDAYETVPGIGTFAYSDVVYTYTDNGGTTWKDVKNLTRTNDLDERYVSVSSVNPGTGIGTDSNYLYLIFHEKATAGTSIQDNRPVRMLTQKFLKINTDFNPLKDLIIAGVQVVNYTGIHAVDVPETIKVKINNGGTEANPTSVTLTYKAGSVPTSSGDGTSQTFTPTWNGKYADVVFSSLYSPVNPGVNLKIFVRVFYTGDLDADNDVGSKTVFISYDKDVIMWSLSQLNVPAPPPPPLGKLPAPQLKVKVRNWGGQTTNPYSINWKVGGVLQTPVSMSVLPYAQFDSSNLSYSSTERGTKFTTVWVDMNGDSVRANDTLGTFLRTYPTNAFAIAYDDSNATADSYWGHDTKDSALACAVRFTATEDMKLTNIDAVINSFNSSDSLIVDSMLVYVWAAGTDTSPGSILWSKKFGGADYLSPGFTGFISFPVDGNLVFTVGTDYWCGIQWTPNINNFYPMGSDDYSQLIPYPPADPKVNRSFFSEDRDKIANQTDALWMPMRNVLIHQPGGYISGRFVIRAIGSPTVPGGTFAVNNAWNMVSIPVNITELKTELFPTATSSAFKFVPGTGYVPQTTMGPVSGYWLKFAGTQTVTLYGAAITNLEIPVVAGWNMIGSISGPIATSAVTTTGSASVASPFYGYSAGYVTVTTLVSGKGYWVKSGGAGNLVLASTLKPNTNNREPDITAFNKLTIADRNGNKQTLYFGENIDGKFPVAWFEMPPTAPEGSFDVRYASQRILEAYPIDAKEALEYAISVKNAQFPITVAYELTSRTKTFVINDGSVNSVLNGDKGSITINNLKSGNLMLKIDALDNIPVDYNLGQNYPNPFNPSTTFEFAMPKIAKVEIVVYDILGSKVATLFDGVKAAGYHKVEWNGKNSDGSVVPSGVYFVKMTSEGFSAVKKSLMLK